MILKKRYAIRYTAFLVFVDERNEWDNCYTINQSSLMMRLTAIPLLVFLLLIILACATYRKMMGASSFFNKPIARCGVVYQERGNEYNDAHPINYYEETLPESVSIQEGKSLFKANCASCHAKNMRSDLTGPALSGVEQRWSAYPKEDLYAFIRNSQGMIEKGHPRANEVWDEWQPTVMNNFPNLSDDQIESLLVYIEMVYH